MQYTLCGYNQQALIQITEETGISQKIDGNDLLFLRWFADFYPYAKKYNIDGQEYAMIKYSKIKYDLPFLALSQRAIARRLEKLELFGILQKSNINSHGLHGVYGFGKNYERLLFSSTEVQMSSTTTEDTVQVSSTTTENEVQWSSTTTEQWSSTTTDYNLSYPRYTKDIHPSTNNPSTNILHPSTNNSNISKDSYNNKLDIRLNYNGFEDFWLVYPRKIEKQNARKKYIERLNDGWSPQELKAAAEEYAQKCISQKTEEKYIKHPATFLGASTPFADYIPKTEPVPDDTDNENPFAEFLEEDDNG